jgi:hypothetical protein
MNNNKSSIYLIIISFISTIGGFLFGYDTAIISGCNSFLQAHFDLAPDKKVVWCAPMLKRMFDPIAIHIIDTD